MSTFAFADIHGRLFELEKLLAYIEYDNDDTLVFLGDYVDRGPDSNGVIEKLIQLQSQHPQTHFLKGNHEVMMLTARRCKETHDVWLYCGGDTTEKSYPQGVPEKHWQFLNSLKRFWENRQAIFVHACVEENKPLRAQSDDVLIWDKLRDPMFHQSGKKIVCGHTTQMFGVPALLGDARCIDCISWLTAIDVERDRVFQVNGYGECRQFDIAEAQSYSNRRRD